MYKSFTLQLNFVAERTISKAQGKSNWQEFKPPTPEHLMSTYSFNIRPGPYGKDNNIGASSVMTFLISLHGEPLLALPNGWYWTWQIKMNQKI